jgi:small GTP-binding protein
MWKKIIILGDSGVGKSRLISKLINGTDIGIQSTIGVDVNCFKIANKTMGLFDLSGSSRFAWMQKLYIENKDAVVIVFAMHNFPSFESVATWLKKASALNPETTPFLLIGIDEGKESALLKKDLETLRYYQNAYPNLQYHSVCLDNTKSVKKPFEAIYEHLKKQENDKKIIRRPCITLDLLLSKKDSALLKTPSHFFRPKYGDEFKHVRAFLKAARHHRYASLDECIEAILTCPDLKLQKLAKAVQKQVEHIEMTPLSLNIQIA